jgi:hypothetical protein
MSHPSHLLFLYHYNNNNNNNNVSYTRQITKLLIMQFSPPLPLPPFAVTSFTFRMIIITSCFQKYSIDFIFFIIHRMVIINNSSHAPFLCRLSDRLIKLFVTLE